MNNEKTVSFYQLISDAVIDGHLPEDFSLPENSGNNEIRWMDGAFDGVSIFHMNFSDLSEENRVRMEKAVQAASEEKIAEADRLFSELGQEAHAIAVIDELQSYIIHHKEELAAGNIYQYAIHAILDLSDKECVKFGLSLLELFDIREEEELKNAIRTIGLSDEFSFFVIFLMLQWEDGNYEVYQLAKKIHGWGRIHAIEHIEPETEEIKQWLLKDGVHNRILPAYSALICWQKSDAERILTNGPSREEFSGIRDIMEGLLDEGPVPGISQIENDTDIMITFLSQAKKMDLNLSDYEVIWEILDHYKDTDHSVICTFCQEILNSDNCKNIVKQAVKEGKAIMLAQDLHLDYKDDLLQLLKTEFDGNFHLCSFLMKDLNYQTEVLKIFRQNLPLEEMKTLPTDSLGLGIEYKRQHQLESILQELHSYPLEGIDFVETALQSAPIRTRNTGIAVLQDWVTAKKTSLKCLLPNTYQLLCHLREIEIDDGVQKKMDKLIENKL